eukprot:TRINITY_DN1573_c0_g2_i1.p1 TRINITY_DN1573_c0_g2~~TRINITY_DN1573_c0_g2_i1.p1  ORF type:complete len:368 (+),score=118.86 TRINITY_DN1573_c0_g2_i1:323-1426(+)
MHELIGDALEEDEQFWRQFGFQEAENDDDYVESSEGIDKVDSDFDRPEDEEEEEIETKSTKEHKKKAAAIPKRRHRKPAATAEQSKGTDNEGNNGKKYKRIAAEVSLPLEQRSVAVREKTLERTKEAQRRFAEWEKRQIEKEQKRQDEPKAAAPEKLTQVEQMKEAAMTEEENVKSLELLKQIELTKQKQGYNKKEVPLNTTIRTTQRIVDGTAIGDHRRAQNCDHRPRICVHLRRRWEQGLGSLKEYLRLNEYIGIFNRKALQCTISGKRAKYLDPMTKMAYATKDAFKILREKFYQLEEEKLQQRIQALNELLSLKKDKRKRHKAGKAGEDIVAAAKKSEAKELISVSQSNLQCLTRSSWTHRCH